jgi:hypothetical protein
MRSLWMALRWGGYIGLFVVLGAALYISSSEAYLYLTRSESKAQAAAQVMFAKICDRQRLDPNSFHGPNRPSVHSDEKLGTYTFMWLRSPEETITVSVTYLPYDLPYSISEAITERKPAPGKAILN